MSASGSWSRGSSVGIIGDATNLPALEAAAKDRDDSVAAAAKRAIARLTQKARSS
jgi:hypothetical protein